MLEIRPSCEIGSKALPPNSTQAMIFSFEGSFCCDCLEDLFQNVCPNCGGGFVHRPIRTKKELAKHPAVKVHLQKMPNQRRFSPLLDKYQHANPSNR
ncbi:MAG: DUF1272 domain-containing protein [Bacteroidetes bacterium]|nr:DUF1272 domain-containing protein [Bacteroidota bacterium]